MLEELERICNLYDIKYFLAYGSMLGAVREKKFIAWDTDVDVCVLYKDYEKLINALQRELRKDFRVMSPVVDSSYEMFLMRIALKDTTHQFLHLDIFPLVGAPKGSINKKIFMYGSYVLLKMFFIKRVHIRSWFKHKEWKGVLAGCLKVILLFISDKQIYNMINRSAIKHSINECVEVYNLYGSYKERDFIPKKWLSKIKYIEFECKLFPVLEEYDAYLKQMYGNYMIPRK